MKHRPRCNRIMGCPGSVTLLNYGKAVTPLLVDEITGASRADQGYWIYALVALMGQLDDERALPFLHQALADPRWELRIRAALAIGMLARPASKDRIEAVLNVVSQRKEAAYEAALRFARAAIVPAEGPRERAAIAAMLMTKHPVPVTTLASIELDLIIEVVRYARIRAALPAVRLAAVHTNRFVREQALKALAALQDTGGIPYALNRLENDTLPSIRVLALQALQRITGNRKLHDTAAWRAWCERHDLAELPPPPPLPAPEPTNEGPVRPTAP